MSIGKGVTVWVEDKDNVWVEGEVFDVKEKRAVVVMQNRKKASCAVEKLHHRDPDADLGGVDDMTKLPYLNEPGVLYNLARRYALNEIYTYTGSILIAVNPFTKLPHLYNIHMMEQYKGVQLGELSPHVFAVADASYRSMMNERRSQSILVSGESGAGKTETTKLIMQYLMHVGGRSSGDARTVEQQVLESNPLLEAFGNAKTLKNDNSSRFGKFVEIQFDGSGRISGAAIRTYLLERSRVVQINDPERNYHCFYQLCASGKDAEKYKLGHPSTFHYLNQSKTFDLNGISNSEEYVKTRRAMDIVGISHGDQEAIFRTLAAILHLGNIEFSPGKEYDSSVVRDNKSIFHLNVAADFLMCDPNILLATLCTRSIQTLEGNITKALDCDAAVASRDALAKTIYSRLFDWLVENINKSVGQDLESRLQIGVLDIYGFECFKYNSFEQFCINFANEKLQQHFNEHVFKMEQEEYSREEINWSYIEFIDNQDVLDLVEKKPIGIISLLDEACMFPKSTHETFAMKLFRSLRTHQRLERAKFSETDFTVSHYAGKVTYQTNSFLDKNRDYIIVEHCNLLSSSKCFFISSLFPSLPEESSRSSYKFSSVASRFKQQLQALMETLHSTEPHYVRCIKPNSLNSPQKFENQSVLHQLRCGGVLEAVRISLAGYPTRRTYSEFVDRFGLLALELMDGRYGEKILAEKILQKLKLENFQLGRSKVFLRAGQIAVLDSRRSEVLDNSAKLIQGYFRTYISSMEFAKTKHAAIILQAFCHGCLSRSIYEKKKQLAAAILIQKFARGWLSRRAFLNQCTSVLLIQCCIRGTIVRRMMHLMREESAAIQLQARWRTWKASSSFQQYKHAAVSVQCQWRQKVAKRVLLNLRKKAKEAGVLREQKNKLEKNLEDANLRLQLEKMMRVSVEESKTEEISRLQSTLASLTAELDAAKLALSNECEKNALLNNRLELFEKDKAALQKDLTIMEEAIKENLTLKTSVEIQTTKNLEMEQELLKTQRTTKDSFEKLESVETKYSQLQQKLERLEEKLSSIEAENHVLREKTLSLTPLNRLSGFARSVFEKNPVIPVLPCLDQKNIYETPTPGKLNHYPHNLSGSWRSRMSVDVDEDHHEILLRCIKEDLGFKEGKPIAACIIYKLLIHWHAFEVERTAIFDYIIEGINDVIKVGNDSDILPYWLSNASALLCLLQRNLRSNGFLKMPRRTTGFSGPLQRIAQAVRSPLELMASDEGVLHVEARYPAILFKQQLTACLEKIFGLIRDNLKKEISPLLGLCIQAPKVSRVPAARSSKSSGSQQQLGNHWDNIIQFLDSLMKRLCHNHVASFFIRKLTTQVFSFINIQLFNSLLLRRECCTFSNGEYVKSGLAELEKWIGNATEEFAGTSWHELNYIRQAVGFLVIHQKRKKSLEEIAQDLCPALTVRQIYRICTMYWDDKYGTQSVSNEVVANMRDALSKNSRNLESNSFLLDDDLSIPFSTEDISKAIPSVDLVDIELPHVLREYPSAMILFRPEVFKEIIRLKVPNAPVTIYLKV